MAYKYKTTLTTEFYEQHKNRIKRIVHNFGKLTIKRKPIIHYSSSKVWQYARKNHISIAIGGSDWKTVSDARVIDVILNEKQ